MDNVTVQVIPSWYLGLSAFLLVLITVMFLAVTVLMVVLIKTIRGVQEPLQGLIRKVNDDVVPKVETLVVRVDGLTERVSGVADNARAISSTARGTVEKVSVGASSISNTLASLTEVGASKLKTVAPLIGVAFTVLKLVKEMREVRAAGTKESKST